MSNQGKGVVGHAWPFSAPRYYGIPGAATSPYNRGKTQAADHADTSLGYLAFRREGRGCRADGLPRVRSLALRMDSAALSVRARGRGRLRRLETQRSAAARSLPAEA